MITRITDMLSDIKGKVQSFTGDGLTVFDPDDMLDMTKHIAPPFVGLVYLGLAPNGQDAQGLSAKMMFGIYVLGTSKNLKGKKGCSTSDGAGVTETDLVSITDFLEGLRSAISGTKAPSNHFWQLRREEPYDFDDKGIGYLQVWHATVNTA